LATRKGIRRRTRMKLLLLTRVMLGGLIAMLVASVAASAGVGVARAPASTASSFSAGPVLDWSTEARRAIVPPSAGPENFGNKFPGEAGVYMGIVHVAIYDAAVAIEGGYKPYAIQLTAPPDTSAAAAIATAAHHTLVGLQPALGLTPTQQGILDGDYAAYLAAIPDGTAKTNGITIGEQVAAAVLALRANDGREKNPTLADLNPPAPGAGVWQPDPTRPVLGLRLPGIRPLALTSASQFRPDGPNPLTSPEYADDLNQVKELGRLDSTTRTPEQMTEALFWTDHDARQWNDGMLRLAGARGLDLVQSARMLAMAHVAGADALIACFDAKYHYWSWRPYQAIAHADEDGNPATVPDPTWQPLRATPNHPEYPSAHACHTTALAEALGAYFGTDKVAFTLDSRVTGTTREYNSFHDAVKEVNEARVLAGFHFRNSDQEGSSLGRKVGRYVVDHLFQPTN
jgi:PAP2 superfamily